METCLGEGWRAQRDSSSGRTYYANDVTEETRWERPRPPDETEIAVSASSCAYVWLLMNGHDYLSGVLVSMWSVRKTLTCAKLVVMVTPDVAEWVREILDLVADSVVCVQPITARCIPLNTPRKQELYSSWCDMSFTKWRALELKAYRKVLLMDADTIVTRRIDELFLLPTPAGTFSSPWHAPWDARSRRPNPFRDLRHADTVPPAWVAEALERGSVCIGTSVLLSPLREEERGAFEIWLRSRERPAFGYPGCSSMFDEQAICAFYAARGRVWTYLDQAYNAIPWKLETGWLRGVEPAVLHYFGSVKPWRMSGDLRGKKKPRPTEGFDDFSAWDEVARDLMVEVPHAACAVVFSERGAGAGAGVGAETAPSEPGESATRKRPRPGEEGEVVLKEEGVDEIESAGESAVASLYDETARFKGVESSDRGRSDFIGLRRVNNFAKIGLNVAAVNVWKLRARREVGFAGLRVFDVACGTGGDVGKFLRSAADSGVSVRAYLAADISPESVRACGEKLARARIPESAAVVVDLSRRDIFHVLPAWAGVSSFHIASCQFALHYFFESEGALRCLARSAGRLLAEGGLFVCVCADGEEVTRAVLLSEARGERGAVRFGRAQIAPSAQTIERLKGGGGGAADPFGLDYEFSMGKHVLGAREFVVCKRALDGVMLREAHMHRIYDASVPELVRRMTQGRRGGSSFWRDLAKQTEVETERPDAEAQLYRAFVYVKDTSDGETAPDEVDRTRKAFLHFLSG